MRSLVMLAVLIPVIILFGQVQRATGDQKSFAERERHGVTYLAPLWQLTLALTDAQSAAVAGRTPIDPQALPRAVAAISQLDQRYGDQLRTHDRWATLRTKIEALPDRFPDASAAYTAYTETTEMALSLFGKVRETSDLIRDPDADAYFLEDAAAEELPETAVAAGRLADLTAIAPTRPQSEQITTISTLTAVRSAVADPSGDLAQDLRSAVDNTQSRTLSGSLLGRLDLFQRSIDKFTAVSAPSGTQIAPGAAPVGSASAELRRAAADLGEVSYTELDALIATRIDELISRQRLAVVTLAVAVLLVVTPVVLTYFPRRGARPEQHPPAQPQPIAGVVRRPLVSTSAGLGAEADGIGEPGWGRSSAPR